MKFFIKKISIFIAFLFFLIIVLQGIITERIEGLFKKNKGILELSSNANADLVLLGSSRCWIQLNSVFFDTTFKIKTVNLGVNGHGEISMAIVRLKQYLLCNTPPKFAILAFDPLSSSGSETNNKNFFIKYSFAEYAFLPKQENLPILNYFNFDNFEKYLPLYAVFKYKTIHSCFSLKENVRCQMGSGSDMYKEKWDTIANPIRWSGNNYDLSTNKIDSIKLMINNLNKLCKKNKIKLLCIQTPVYRNLYDSTAFYGTRKICLNFNIPIIDVNKKYINNNILYFYNSNHLNKRGIAEMNLVLKSDSTLNFFLHN